MQQRKSPLLARLCPATLLACAGALGAGGCGDTGLPLGGARAHLEVACLEEDAPTPADGWLCPAPRTVDCSQGLPPLYVRDDRDPSCSTLRLDVAAPSPLRAGVNPVRVTREDGSLACETTLTLSDAVAPVLTPKTIKLWPPNHKLHTITVADCVSISDSCDSDPRGEFVWASSDEPIDDLGDGHHRPDIVVDDCGRVRVRAERQGPKDGRVYKLGVRVVDGAGNAAESACTIIVDHDQRGVTGADSGEQYRVLFDGRAGLPACDGVDEPPAVPPVSPPDAGWMPPPPADAGVPPDDMVI